MKNICFLLLFTFLLSCNNKEKNIETSSDLVIEEINHKNIVSKDSSVYSFWKPLISSNIHRPYFLDEKINLIVSDFLNRIEKVTMDYHEKYYSGGDDSFDINYEVTFENDNIISILFVVFTAEYREHYPLCIDRKKSKIISFFDIFETSDKIIEILEDYFPFSNGPEYVEALFDENYGFDPIRIFLTKENLVIKHYRGSGRLTNVPLNELMDYKKIGLDNPKKPFTRIIGGEHYPFFETDVDIDIENAIQDIMDGLDENIDKGYFNIFYEIIDININSVDFIFYIRDFRFRPIIITTLYQSYTYNY